MENLKITPNVYYLIGYYVQDFKEPAQLTNKETGEVTFLDYHRVLLQFLAPVDVERWGCNSAVGNTVVEFPVNLDMLPTAFGTTPDKFDIDDDLPKLLNAPCSLNFTFNKKGKAVLRGITPMK